MLNRFVCVCEILSNVQMADKRICVLEDSYAKLANAGVPVSICLQLQQHKLSLANAQWTQEKLDTGYSMSFFWPLIPPKHAKKRSTKRKQRGHMKGTTRCSDITTCPADDRPAAYKAKEGKLRLKHSDDAGEDRWTHVVRKRRAKSHKY